MYYRSWRELLKEQGYCTTLLDPNDYGRVPVMPGTSDNNTKLFQHLKTCTSAPGCWPSCVFQWKTRKTLVNKNRRGCSEPGSSPRQPSPCWLKFHKYVFKKTFLMFKHLGGKLHVWRECQVAPYGLDVAPGHTTGRQSKMKTICRWPWFRIQAI